MDGHRFRKTPDAAWFAERSFAGVKRVLEPFLASAGSDDRLLFALAGVHQALGEYRDAVDLYEKYLSHAGASVPVLNALGECHERLGEFMDALSAFERSLELKPDQDAVRKRVEELRKKRWPGA